MLKTMILINAAEFDYLEIDLQKDLFFAGDNGTGKTSSIIALFYLFSGDNHSRKLGISSDKKVFKEYYFPDERNSYLIYVFDDFFILMYRQSGEIIKYFSRQSFDIKELKAENGALLDIKDIRRYIKRAPLHHLVKSTDDYRQIIYGQNRKYLDFSITDIRHYDIFIELFSQTFNVDKSIVDAKSIKRAIQKSINQGDRDIEFDYQKYMDKIKEFQNIYTFFKNFEKEESSIDSAIELRDTILQSQRNIESIEAQILYRRELEKEQLIEFFKSVTSLNSLELSLQKTIKQKNVSINRCEKRFLNEAARLGADIEMIEGLKKKFTLKLYDEEIILANKFYQLEQNRDEKQKQKTLLELDIESAIVSIEREINALQYQHDIQLVTQSEDRLREVMRQADDELGEYKEKENHKKEIYEHQNREDRRAVFSSIDESKTKDDELRSSLSAIREQYQKELDLLMEEKRQERSGYHKEIERLEYQVRQKKRELEENSLSKEHLQEEYAQNRRIAMSSLCESRGHIHNKLLEARSILDTPVGSFKEFLQQSDISWERELYPFMDSSLLSLSVDELQPEIVDSDNPLGIKISMRSLKQIPTREEAEESIAKHKEDKKQLFYSYNEKKATNKIAYQQVLNRIKYSHEAIATEMKNLKESIGKYHNKLSLIDTQEIPDMKKRIKVRTEEEMSSVEKSREDLRNGIKNLENSLDILAKELREFSLKSSEEMKLYHIMLEADKKSKNNSINQWLKSEQEKIKNKIVLRDKSKLNISKDEKLIVVDSELKSLKQEVERSYRAKQYIEEYEKQKPLIQSYESKATRLFIATKNRDSFKEHIENKIEKLTVKKRDNLNKIKEIKEEIEKLQNGLNRSKKIEIDIDNKEECSEYLEVLMVRYDSLKSDYIRSRAKLQNTLLKFNRFKQNPFVDISFNIDNFDQFEKFSEDSENIEGLNELQEFKNKKLSLIKNNTNQDYINFIKDEIPVKLGRLSNSEDKFEKQVKRINKNLSIIDFSIVKDIKILTEIGNKKSVMKLLNDIKSLVENLTISDSLESLFFEKIQTNQDLKKIENLLKEIKDSLNGGAITLLDTIDLALEFTENGTKKIGVTQIKNESSTGGTILLKMALAVSILGLYTNEKETKFFLILDEVSRLHSHNQDILRNFANSRGFRIVFVTPEPIYAKPDEIRYYKFQRRDDNRFEAISLNHTRKV